MPRPGGIKRRCCICRVHAAGRLDSAYWLIGPGSAWLKDAHAHFRCMPGRGHIVAAAAARLQFNIFLLSIRSGAHKLLRRFFNFAKNLPKLWRHLATGMRTSRASEKTIPSEKRWNRHQNRPINDTKPAQSIPLERTAHRPQSGTKINIIQTHFRTYSRRALFDLPKLCTAVELVVPILKGANHFSIQYSVFPLRGKILICIAILPDLLERWSLRP